MYNHDLRASLFGNKGTKACGDGLIICFTTALYIPRTASARSRITIDINRGDKFDYMVAMSSGSLGLQDYRKEKLDANDSRHEEV
ncbi:MAG: hypothetical protein IPG67_17180 [Acidobacteria bacterium]|nr:hypothetical protein [Acidobacteriota bacterium]